MGAVPSPGSTSACYSCCTQSWARGCRWEVCCSWALGWPHSPCTAHLGVCVHGCCSVFHFQAFLETMVESLSLCFRQRHWKMFGSSVYTGRIISCGLHCNVTWVLSWATRMFTSVRLAFAAAQVPLWRHLGNQAGKCVWVANLVKRDQHSDCRIHLGQYGTISWASLVAQMVKNMPAMLNPWVGKIPWRRQWLPTLVS